MHRLHTRASLLLFGLVMGFVLACRHTPPETEAAANPPGQDATLRGGWWRDAVFYEIFVRSFADADGDGVGDFRGLREALPYLSGLGVNAVWLMPIHPSPSYHGYDVTDDRAVKPQYGSLEDFRQFIDSARAQGVRVIIDFVMNHASREHPWFQDAVRDPKSPHRDDFVFKDAPDERWKRPWDGGSVWYPAKDGVYYGLFWEGMPDWNLRNPDVEAHMIESMRFWLRLGVAGFRVDAARHLFESDDGVLVDQPENHAFMKRVRAALEPEFPEMLLVAEAWSDTETVAAYYGQGDEFHLAFSFDLAAAVKTSVNDGNRADLNQALARAQKAYVDRAFEAPFLANHDMQRVMRSFGGDAQKAKLAASALMALPGTPFLYYGEELGMQGGPSSKDEDKRTPFPWGESSGVVASWYPFDEKPEVSLEVQRGQAESIYETYRRLIETRKNEPALRRGEVVLVPIRGGGRGTVAVLRRLKEDSVLFVANFADEPAEVSVSVPVRGAVLFSLGSVETTDGPELSLRLGPRSAAFMK